VIPANKGGLMTALVDWYIRRKMRSAFRGLWLKGSLPPITPGQGLVVYANHTSFWDGFVVHQLGQAANWSAYAMMEEENLAKYPFHTRIGAFSVRRGDPRSALETLKYAKGVLHGPNEAIFVFPQGEIRPPSTELGPLKRGLDVLVRSAKARAVPVAIRYVFFENERPDVLVEVGQPHEAVPEMEYTHRLEEVVGRLMQAPSVNGFSCLRRGSASVQERWDVVRGLFTFKRAKAG
jgi:1-acyl-sn-glycerol-3-phosphate acyltransferase